MSLYEQAVALGTQLPLAQREQLALALGLKLAPKNLLPLHNATLDRSKTDPKGWAQSERGHAVLATNEDAGNLAPGAPSLRGLWARLDFADAFLDVEGAQNDTVSALPQGTPVVVHTSVVTALALDLPSTRAFWESPNVEIRLATATYLSLLERCENEAQLARVQAFIAPFAVLSLGPMASNKSVQLMLEGGVSRGLTALDALVAATAIAHEIPLVTRTLGPFAGVPGLLVATLP